MNLKNKLYKSVIFLILILSANTAVCSSNNKNSKKVKNGWSEAYGGVIKNSKVICSKKLILDGSLKDGINFPNKKNQVIYLDCDKWSVHEYLPLLGRTDTNYAVTSEMVGNYKAKLRSRTSY
ncbi:hypothetical protein SHI21_18035 [Bacteriovorax sp. PP10]|uniref:Uncharacterized protein n=1 Tax=Bacteriovorax antarcticus TaxID=3088717 RepID=A0ABU5W0R2_9BACT|nr:hypothetical protein [Bacteriovorax sp. PP10]MEA9358139.1 hypothetical protein [Bacteriovorax sp. PP10]